MPADIEPIPSRKKTAYSCAIFFLFVSAVCQITGLILRWWMTLSLVQLQVSIEVGLFYTTICILDSCQSVSTDKFVKDNIPELTTDDLNEHRIMAVLGTSMCLVALITMTSLLCCSAMSAKRLKICLLIVVVGLILSGSLSMAAAGKLGRFVIKYLENLPDSYVAGAPYALILMGVGGLITGLLLFPMGIHTYNVWNQGEVSSPAVMGPHAGPPAGQSNITPAGGQMTFYSPVYSVSPTAPPLEAYYGYNPPNYDQHNYPTFPMRPPIQSQPLEN